MLDNTQNSSLLHGTIVVNRPICYQFLVVGSGIMLLGGIALGYLCTYAEQYRVKGSIHADKGIVRVHAPDASVLRALHVKCGDKIKIGEKLFEVIFLDNSTKKIKVNLLSMRERVTKAIEHKLAYLSALKPLLTNKNISLVLYQREVDALRDLQLEKNKLNLEWLKEQRALSREIISPISGRILHIEHQPGQFLSATKSVVSLLPEESAWIVELKVPLIATRFLKIHTPVVLQYDAYPYMQFGVGKGWITSISEQVFNSTNDGSSKVTEQSYYKVIVKLDSQFFNALQQRYPLHEGMTLTAILNGPRQSLWKWVWLPLSRGWLA